jgi:amidase
MGPAVTSLIEHSLAAMQTAGATVVDETDLETYEDWRASEMIVLQYEFKADLNRYLAARGGAVKSLGDCIAFNRAHAAQEMPYFAQELMEMSQEKGSLEDKTYKDALATCRRLTRKQGIDAVLAKYKLDAIVAPTAGPAFVTDLVTGDRVDSGCASPPAVSGYPHITVPAGYVFGLPVGISFFGPPWSEPKLIRFAYAFEQTQPTRRPPQFLPTANLRL